MYPQTTNPDEMYFHEQNDTFDLTAAFKGDKLTITLKDFIDWTIYSKTYTEQDIGREINRRMDLIDVYTAFSQTQPQCDEENMKQKSENTIRLKRYQFGDVIVNGNHPCYKIQSQGKIITYLNIIDVRTKNQITFQSKLNLTKLRNMTETEISTQRATIEKKSLFDELNKEIEKQKREKEELVKRIINLQNQNARLTKEAIQAQQELKKTKEELTFRIQSLEQRITAIKQEQNQKIQIQIQKIQAQALQTKQELTEKLQLQTQRSLDKIAELQLILKPIITIHRFHTLQQFHRSYFKTDGLKVQYTASPGHTQYIFNEPISHKQSANFKIKISFTQFRQIMVGVVDYAKQKDQRDSYSSGNAMCYYGYDYRKFPGEGDIVEVDVNRSTSTIKYLVNGTLKATHTNNMLADSSRVFMPYVSMYNTNDAVEWLLD